MNILTRAFAVVLVCAMVVGQQSAMAAAKSTITPSKLTCEYDSSPIIDILTPRLAWVNENPRMKQGAAQTAYRVRVATSADGFDKPYWDSGKVYSSESAFIKYAGPKLKSRTSYWWQVMVWDENDRASEWSEVQSWHVGMLSADEWHLRVELLNHVVFHFARFCI